MVISTLTKTLNILAWAVIFICSAFSLYLYWEDSQDVMRYIDMKPQTSPSLSDDSVRIALVGEKKLDCARVAWSEMGYAIIDGYNTEVAFRWVDDLSPLSSLTKGKWDIGIAEFNHVNVEQAEFVGFNIEHICHGVHKTSPIYWFQVTNNEK